MIHKPSEKIYLTGVCVKRPTVKRLERHGILFRGEPILRSRLLVRREWLLSKDWTACFITGVSQRLEPIIECCLFLSFFQSLLSRAPFSAVIKSLS